MTMPDPSCSTTNNHLPLSSAVPETFIVSTLWSLVFWFSCVYVVLLFFVAFVQALKKDLEGEKPTLKQYLHRSTGMFAHLKICGTVSELCNNAFLIAIAILLSDLFQQMFVCIYWSFNETSNSAKCPPAPQVFGNYGCAFNSGDDDDQPWAVVVPAFLFTVCLVIISIFVTARCCTGVWVEIVSGFGGHLVGFRCPTPHPPPKPRV